MRVLHFARHRIHHPSLRSADVAWRASSLAKWVAAIAVLLWPVALAEAGERLAWDASGVHVAGNGVVEAAPDRVAIHLTVTTVDDNLMRVRENSDRNARVILESAKKYRCGESDFSVTSHKLSFDYSAELRCRVYHVERRLTIVLGDPGGLDAMLIELLRDGNIKVEKISMFCSKARQYSLDAMHKALADAHERALHLAEIGGRKLGKARNIRSAGESETPFVISVVPVVGAVEGKSPGGRRAATGLSAVPTDDSFQEVAAAHLAAPEADQKAAENPGPARVRALGLLRFTAGVEVDYDWASAASGAKPRLVSVSGEGRVEVMPDHVVVQVAITSVDDDLVRARETSDKDSQAIRRCAERHGGDGGRFRVVSQKPLLDFDKQLRRRIYKIENHITVQVRDVANLDSLLVDLLREDNLEVETISYGTAKERQHSFAAVGKAVADAKERARVLAEASGLKLGTVRDVSVLAPLFGQQGDESDEADPFTASSSGGGMFSIAPALNAPVLPLPPEKKPTDGQPGRKPFALRQIDVSAMAKVQFEMTE